MYVAPHAGEDIVRSAGRLAEAGGNDLPARLRLGGNRSRNGVAYVSVLPASTGASASPMAFLSDQLVP